MRSKYVLSLVLLLPLIVGGISFVACDSEQQKPVAVDNNGKEFNAHIVTINGHRYVTNGSVFAGYRHEASCEIHDLDSILHKK